MRVYACILILLLYAFTLAFFLPFGPLVTLEIHIYFPTSEIMHFRFAQVTAIPRSVRTLIIFISFKIHLFISSLTRGFNFWSHAYIPCDLALMYRWMSRT